MSKLLRSNLYYTGDVGGRHPVAETITHLSEYVLRLALREHWDLADQRAVADRLRRLMFAERSELAELAALSNMSFSVDSATDLEQVPILPPTSDSIVAGAGLSHGCDL